MKLCKMCLKAFKKSKEYNLLLRECRANQLKLNRHWPKHIYFTGDFSVCNTHAIQRKGSSQQHAAKREKRLVAWAELSKIKKFYEQCPHGYEVDHVIPLNGRLVSGLHVIKNLQYLPKKENRAKSNHYIP